VEDLRTDLRMRSDNLTPAAVYLGSQIGATDRGQRPEMF
jgi:hypothetical protein